MLELESTPDQSQHTDLLVIIIIGASGDLAKKKIYPSLYNLFLKNHLPPKTVIWGYGRTNLTRTSLHQRLLPHLPKDNVARSKSVDDFLFLCHYQRGSSYTDVDAFQNLRQSLPRSNTLFYLAVPPNLFHHTARTIDTVFTQQSQTITEASRHTTPPWNRIVLEKPFGRDLSTYKALSRNLSHIFQESQMYRIDHYLGKEMVRSIPSFRLRNSWTRSIWSRACVECVSIVMKEDFGTEGRGGYFDNYGIVRDVMQNHLLQLLTLVAMEIDGKGSMAGANPPSKGQNIALRDAKVAVLKAIRPPSYPADCVLGQYEGYTDDPTVSNKSTTTPTYAAVRLHVNNDRWRGVPFIFEAGKALDECKVEIRLTLRNEPKDRGVGIDKSSEVQKELVIRIQPQPCICLKTTVETQGDNCAISESTMILNSISKQRDDAYGKLIQDALRGHTSSFVRDDELLKSWEIFTPLLEQIKDARPYPYEMGSCGPREAASFVREVAHKDGSSCSTANTISRL